MQSEREGVSRTIEETDGAVWEELKLGGEARLPSHGKFAA